MVIQPCSGYTYDSSTVGEGRWELSGLGVRRTYYDEAGGAVVRIGPDNGLVVVVLPVRWLTTRNLARSSTGSSE